jgi:predicted DsbA family dithiol-disulfide isomerase
MKIEIYSDVVCPWCFIGTERLDRVISSLEKPVEIVRRPFLLMPDTPPEGRDLHLYLKSKYRVEPERMFVHVREQAQETGLALDPAKQRFIYPTLRAHTLLRHAAEKGTQRALERALFVAYFIDAENISDPQFLGDLAAKHGFTVEEAQKLILDDREIEKTRREAEAPRSHGINGVPFFIFDEKWAISGAQPESVFREALSR